MQLLATGYQHPASFDILKIPAKKLAVFSRLAPGLDGFHIRNRHFFRKRLREQSADKRLADIGAGAGYKKSSGLFSHPAIFL
jgi:hypothetical protein